MLTIRREQERLLESVARESWAERMADSVVKNYPRQFEAMERAEVCNFIFRAIEKGSTNHVETEGGVAVLIDLMVQFGEKFENSRDKAWADEILAHATLPPEVKLPLLYRRMTQLSRGRVIVPFSPGEAK